jgi:apolipoprotein N-acyltransferase
VIGVPWFGVAASLVAWPALLGGVAVAGSGGLGALAAAGWGAILAGRAEPRTGVATAILGGGVVMGALLLPAPSGAGGPQSFRVAVLEWERSRAENADPEALRAGVRALVEAPLPADLLAGAPPAVLWPEAPLSSTADADSLALAYLRRVVASGAPAAPEGSPGAAGDVDTPGPGAVAGIHAEVDGRRYNTLVRTTRFGDPPQGVHRKRFLVPGVERSVLLGAGREGRGLAPGAGALPFEWGGRTAGGLICFEVLVPAEVARLRRRGAEFLVQGASEAMLQPGGLFPVVADAGRRQHAALARLRAAEFRIPLVRATLGGVALGVGPDGRLLEPAARLPLARGAWVVHELPAMGPPPPAAWLAPLTGPGLLGLLLVPLVFAWRRDQLLLGRVPGGTV